MELRHLKYFLTVAEELHFGKAAKKLFITQPPLSRQIQILEGDLGVSLFERNRKRVRLTAQGRYLKEEASKLFTQVESLRSHVRLLEDGAEGLLKIGYVGSAMHSVLPGLLSDLRLALPGLHVSLCELKSLDQVSGLRYGSIDIGFIRTPIAAEGLDVRPFFSETLSLVIPRSHPAARAKSPRPADLSGEPFIGFCRDCAPGLYDTIIGLCNREGFSPRIVHESSQINSVIRLVESGWGYSIMPTSVRNGYSVRVRFQELADDPERAELAVAFDPSNLTPPAARAVEAVLGPSRARFGKSGIRLPSPPSPASKKKAGGRRRPPARDYGAKPTVSPSYRSGRGRPG